MRADWITSTFLYTTSSLVSVQENDLTRNRTSTSSSQGNVCILLFWWGGHCCPMLCDLFKIYCASRNLGITRTWICRLNFAQRPIFSGSRFFNEPEISDSEPKLKVPPGGLVLSIFTSWKKSIDVSRVWIREPWISRRARYPETT